MIFSFAKDHLDFYHEYVNVEQKYLAGIKEVRTKLEILDDEFHHRFDHNPIHHMEWRLKSPHSVVEKMKRRNLSCRKFHQSKEILKILLVYV